MPAISSTTLVNGYHVDIYTTDIPRNGVYTLMANLFDANGSLIRNVLLDTAFNSDGTSAPPRAESYSNFSLVPLSQGGFAVAYDDTVINPPGGSNEAQAFLVDAAGRIIGGVQIGTSSPGQPFPRLGSPTIYPTTTNGAVFVVTETDSRIHVINGDYQIGDRIYDTRPVSIYDSGPTHNEVVTVASAAGGFLREVLENSGQLISSSPVATITGTTGPDVLTGGAGADDLIGGAGADVLRGGAGFDILTGGAGGDRFVFALDGSVDQVTDFDPSADTLAIVDAGGANLVSASAILTFDRGSGLVTYDPDGGNGPAPAQAVAVLTGAHQLTAANFAPGFEPALVRVINPLDVNQALVGGPLAQGSHSDIVYGFGKTLFSSASADYSAGGVLQAYTVNFNIGTRSVTFFDQLNQQAFDHVVADYATNGQVAFYSTYFDDQTKVLWQFDAVGDQIYSRIVDHYDAIGRLATRDVVYDDGSRYAATFDVANTQPYGYAVDTFDASGRQTGHTLFNDDGSVFH